MRARFVSEPDLDALLDPEAAAWHSARSHVIDLMGTPVGLQPSPLIRATWSGKPIGAVDRVRVAALHNGQALAFRLEWEDATENGALSDNTSFPDAAAVLLPSVPGAPVMTMGAPGAAVNAWYWRADEPESGRNVVAEGLGTTRTLDTQLVRARGIWKAGRWGAVIGRPLRVDSEAPLAQLEPGAVTGFAVAVWEGGHGERAGIKAFSGDWRELRLDTVPTVGRSR